MGDYLLLYCFFITLVLCLRSTFCYYTHILLRIGHGFAMIIDDIGGVPLKSMIPASGMDIMQFLDIACNISMHL